MDTYNTGLLHNRGILYELLISEYLGKSWVLGNTLVWGDETEDPGADVLLAKLGEQYPDMYIDATELGSSPDVSMHTTRVISDILPTVQFNKMVRYISESKRYGVTAIVNGYPGKQFVYTLYSNDSGVNYVKECPGLTDILDILGVNTLLRVKVNVTHSAEDTNPTWHIDNSTDGSLTAVVYLNTCNGYTIFADDGHIEYSEENKAVIFNTNKSHSGMRATDGTDRYVLNINYIPIVNDELGIHNK